MAQKESSKLKSESFEIEYNGEKFSVEAETLLMSAAHSIGELQQKDVSRTNAAFHHVKLQAFNQYKSKILESGLIGDIEAFFSNFKEDMVFYLGKVKQLLQPEDFKSLVEVGRPQLELRKHREDRLRRHQQKTELDSSAAPSPQSDLLDYGLEAGGGHRVLEQRGYSQESPLWHPQEVPDRNDLDLPAGVFRQHHPDADVVQDQGPDLTPQEPSKARLTQERVDSVNLNNLEDFEMNFDREIMSYSKNITNVVLFGCLNWLDDVAQYTQLQGSAWDELATDLFKEFWKFIISIIVHAGQDLTEDDLCNKIKNIMIDIENEHSPDKVSKSKIKSLVQNKLYQTFLTNLKKLNTEQETGCFRLILHGIVNEIQGKSFQLVYRNEFGSKKRLYESDFSSIMDGLVKSSNENLVNIISLGKNELENNLNVGFLLIQAYARAIGSSGTRYSDSVSDLIDPTLRSIKFMMILIENFFNEEGKRTYVKHNRLFEGKLI